MKKTLLVGNGVIIQHGGKDYTNKSIIQRALKNVDSGRFPAEAYPKETAQWLRVLHQNFNRLFDNDFDQHTLGSNEARSLARLKRIYKPDVKIYDVGIEDYIFFHHIFCNSNKIRNPERYNVREILIRMFLDSIYNFGKLNLVHNWYTDSFIEFVKSFDIVYTTNYDLNLERIHSNVEHLHGRFDRLDYVYDKSSLRHKLSDESYVEPVFGYEYLFSTAMITGTSKDFAANMIAYSNSVLTKLTDGIKSGDVDSKSLDEWSSSDNLIIKNLSEAIKLKMSDPSAELVEQYAYPSFENLHGELHILGLSPNNDTHIFDRISQERLNVYYYYYSDDDQSTIMKNYPTYTLVSARDFWKSM